MDSNEDDDEDQAIDDDGSRAAAIIVAALRNLYSAGFMVINNQVNIVRVAGGSFNKESTRLRVCWWLC